MSPKAFVGLQPWHNARRSSSKEPGEGLFLLDPSRRMSPLGGGGLVLPARGGRGFLCRITKGWSGQLGASGAASEGCPRETSLAAEEYPRSRSRGESSLPPQKLAPFVRAQVVSECSSFLPAQVEPREVLRSSSSRGDEGPCSSPVSPLAGNGKVTSGDGSWRETYIRRVGCPRKQVPGVADGQEAAGGSFA